MEIISNSENKALLSELGIEYCTLPKTFTPTDDGYVKLNANNDMLGNLDSAMKFIPSILHGANSADTYKVIYNKGLYALQHAADDPNVNFGTLVEKGTNNVIKGQAKLQKASSLPQVASSVFSVMSMVTGQYYMSQINTQLSTLQQGIGRIESALYNRELSILENNCEILDEIKNMICSGDISDDNRQYYSFKIKDIKYDSRKTIKYFTKQINTEKKQLDKNRTKSQDSKDIISHIGTLISGLNSSVYLYCYACFIEILFHEIHDKEKLDYALEDMRKTIGSFCKNINDWKGDIENYIGSAKSLNTNAGLEMITAAPVVCPPLIPLIPVAVGTKLLQIGALEIEKKAKEGERNRLNGIINSFVSIDTESLQSIPNCLESYNNIYNKPLEIIRYNDEFYMKQVEIA